VAQLCEHQKRNFEYKEYLFLKRFVCKSMLSQRGFAGYGRIQLRAARISKPSALPRNDQTASFFPVISVVMTGMASVCHAASQTGLAAKKNALRPSNA